MRGVLDVELLIKIVIVSRALPIKNVIRSHIVEHLDKKKR
jgi:hypothetical protein